jgi:hypothetical protein
MPIMRFYLAYIGASLALFGVWQAILAVWAHF